MATPEITVAELVELVNATRNGMYRDPADERCATEATADVCSAMGTTLQYAPDDLSDLIREAVELGYLIALTHVRNGRIEIE